MRKFGSWSEQEDIKLRTSGDSKEVTLAIPATLTGASNTFTTPNISGTADNLISRTSDDTGLNRLQNKDLSTDTIALVDGTDFTKKLLFNLSGISSSTTHTLTVPNLSDTVVTETHGQTLTNKTLTANNTLIRSSSGTNRDVDFDIGGAADSTKTTLLFSQQSNRALSFPDATDTLVGKATTDTFTNKTFDVDGTGNSLTNIANANIKAGADIAITKLAALGTSKALVTNASGVIIVSGVTATELSYVGGVTSSLQTQLNSKQAEVITTRGDLVYGNASNNADRLALGASGTVLTSDGTDVIWSTPAGTGDVTSGANLTDHALVRGDGGAKGIQDSGILIDDSDNITAIKTAQADNGFLNKIENDSTFTIPSGYSMVNNNMSVRTGTTVTVASGAYLDVFDSLTVSGDMVISGDVTIRTQFDEDAHNAEYSASTPNFTNGLIVSPTDLDDATATKLGLKVYDISAHLNLGTGGSIDLAEATPYQRKNGSWGLRYNILLSGTTNASAHDFTIDGVQWGGANFQAGTASGLTAGGFSQSGVINSSPASMVVRYPSSTNFVRISGDFTLASKPTWAI